MTTTTNTGNASKILDSIPRMPKDKLNEGIACNDFVSIDISFAVARMIAEDDRMRKALPRKTDIYRFLVDKGLDILEGITRRDILDMNGAFTGKTRKMQCGFSKETNIRIYQIRQNFGLYDYEVRRLALKLGFEATFGE